MYNKIIKYILWLLLALSAAVAIWSYAAGFTDTSINALLYWAYVLIVVGIVVSIAVAIIISAINNPKSLLKMLIGLVGVGIVVLIAYLVAPGTPARGYLGPEVSATTLKLTDTILNLTYFLCAGAIISIIVGVIVNAVRSK